MPAATMRPARDLFLLVSLCPLLAVTDTVAKAVGLGVAIVVVTAITSTVCAVVKRWINDELQLPTTLLVLSSVVAIAELILQAWFHDLRQLLGLFLPLIVSNAAILWTLNDRSAGARETVLRALKLTLWIAPILVLLGIAREWVGRGSLMHGAASLLGSWASRGELSFFRVDMGFLLAMLPPGAFMAFGVLLAMRNWVVQRKLPRS